MRRQLLLLVLMGTLTAMAGSRYGMRYVKGHWLYQKGSDTNVIDMDLEWPEMIDGTMAVPLQRELTQMLFGVASSTMDSARTVFFDRFGQPVRRQFETIPDDSRFCYVTCKLQLLGHSYSRYVSFRVSYQCSPEQHSTQKGDTIQALITYDMVNGKVMHTADLLRVNRLRDGYADETLIYALLAGADVQLPAQIYALQVGDACLAEGGVLIDMCCEADDGVVPFTTTVAVDKMRSLLTKAGRRLIEGAPRAEGTGTYALPMVIGTDTIYNKVDEEPRFEAGGMSLAEYVRRNLQLPEGSRLTPIGARQAIVAFVVDALGRAVEPRILFSASPEIDRELVRLVRLMPAWNPAVKGGRKVGVWRKLPITING